MRWLIWTPRALYAVSLLAFLGSALLSAPAWGIAVQAFAWAALIQIGLAIYAEVLQIREALDRGSLPPSSEALNPPSGVRP